MKKSFLLLGCAAALTMASCSQEKSADTATTTAPTESTMPADGTAMNSDAAYRDRADRIASRMASDMKISDTATIGKIRTVYYNRSRRLGDLQNQYTSDTTGMYSAMRDVDTNTDTEMKSVFTDPTQYQSYQTNRTNYAESNYMDNSDAMASDASMSDASTTAGSSDAAMSADKMKLKGENGSKLKVKSDGDVKVKDAQDNKAKMDADDGTIKLKPEDGKKTKIE